MRAPIIARVIVARVLCLTGRHHWHKIGSSTIAITDPIDNPAAPTLGELNEKARVVSRSTIHECCRCWKTRIESS